MTPTPTKPAWINLQSMYAGAYLNMQAVVEFTQGVESAHKASGEPDDMAEFVRGVRAARDDALLELGYIARQVPEQQQAEARRSMDELIAWRKSKVDKRR